MKAEEFTSLVEKLVEKNVKKILERTVERVVEKVLTEKFIRKIVSEQPIRRKRNVTETPTTLEQALQQDDDVIPEPMENEHDGIYHESNPQVQLQSEEVERNPLLRADNPFRSVYENVKPIPRDSSPVSSANGDVAPPIKDLKKVGFDFGRMRQISRAANSKGGTSVPPVETAEYKQKMAELERKRRALEFPVTRG